MAGHWLAKNFKLDMSNPLAKEAFKNAEQDPARAPYEFTLTIKTDDVDQFVIDPSLTAAAFGVITSAKISQGVFNLFTEPLASPNRDTAKEMHYTLYLQDSNGADITFFGFKEVIKEDGFAAWDQTTTLYFYLWRGHSPFAREGTKDAIGVGVLHISVSDFIKQLGTFHIGSDDVLEKEQALQKFLTAFAGQVWQAYAPFLFTTTSARWNEHLFPMHTTQGVAQGEKNFYSFDTDDGLTIAMQRFSCGKSKNVVLLMHGLTTSTDMYIMPEHQNLVNHLHSEGFTDVWSLEWRGSSRFTYNLMPHRYTIDDIAKHDMPRALDFIREKCGPDVQIHIICHCVGSLSLMTSLAAGYSSFKNIKSIISNSVSLTPRVRWQSLIKLLVGPNIMEYLFGYAYISPRMAYFPGPGFGKWIYWMERMIRTECKEPACHLVSFMWGWGFPGAYNHRNIHPTTHRRLVDLFGGVSFHYYRHIVKMVLNKSAISYDRSRPGVDYLEEARSKKWPKVLLISGADNHIFPNSNKVTYEMLKGLGSFSYEEFPNYGHQDIFMGQYSHIEIFPKLVDFIKRNI
jgi:triacylglycerol lipase/cholesterol oxidase